jgi:hypothetical protein
MTAAAQHATNEKTFTGSTLEGFPDNNEPLAALCSAGTARRLPFSEPETLTGADDAKKESLEWNAKQGGARSEGQTGGAL